MSTEPELVSIIQYLCSVIQLSIRRVILFQEFLGVFCSPVFRFHFIFSLSFVLYLSSTQFHPHTIPSWQKPSTSSPLHPPIITHTRDQITLTRSTPLLSNNRSISSFSTAPGHHLCQPDFHQHPGKLGSTSSGVSERRHYRIHHPVLQHGRHQGVQKDRQNNAGKLFLSPGKPTKVDRVWDNGPGTDGSWRRTWKFTAAHSHRGRWYVSKQSPGLF